MALFASGKFDSFAIEEKMSSSTPVRGGNGRSTSESFRIQGAIYRT